MTTPTVTRLSDEMVCINHPDGRKDCRCGVSKNHTDLIYNEIEKALKRADSLVLNHQQHGEDEPPLTMPVFNYARDGQQQHTVIVPHSVPASPPPVLNAEPDEEPLTMPVYSGR